VSVTDGENHSVSGCYTCHDNSGDATRGQIKSPGAYTTTITQGNCSACHTAYFEGHATHTGEDFGHDVAYDNSGPGPDQTAGGSGCGDCHTPISTWSEIVSLHDHKAGNCDTCHAYNGGNGEHDNTPAGTVADVIATGTTVTCADCHTNKAGQNHGGHTISDWDYSADSSDCKDCHSGFELTGTIAGVHADQCHLCHVDEPGGDYTRKVGPGGDGSSLLASGRTGTCLTCHNPAQGYTKTSIHHDTADAIASPTSACTSCHNTTNGHAGDHQTIVTDTALCANCHLTTAPTNGDNVPVDATPGNYVHDYCTSCHVNPSNDLIATITPPSANGYVPTTMNNADGTTDTTNGGGACIACHTTGFDVHTKDHGSIVITPTDTSTNTKNCLSCHIAGTAPFVAGDDGGDYKYASDDVHDANNCFTCHDSGTGGLTGSANGADINGIAPDAAYECGECHAGYFDSHTVHTATAGHTVEYDGGTEDYILSTAGCGSCHAVQNWSAIYTLHDHKPGNCDTCHAYTQGSGQFNNTPDGTVASVILASSDPTICTDCHTEKKGADHGSVDHLTYTDGGGDGAVKGLGTSCVVCHTGDDADSFYIDTLHDGN
jgi:hypothetical protein